MSANRYELSTLADLKVFRNALPLPRLQLVGTRGQVLGQDTSGAVGPANALHTRAESRYLSRIGPSKVSELRSVFGNFYVLAGSGDSITDLNTVTLEHALEISNANPNTPATVYPKAYPMSFGGAFTKAMEAGTYHLMSDPLGIDVPAGASVWTRTGLTFSAGQKYPRGPSVSAIGEKAVESASVSSQIMTTGALATPSGGAESAAYVPLGLVGISEKPMPAVFIIGDSIADGTGDAADGDTLGGRGFAARGLNNITLNGITGNFIPWFKSTRASDNALTYRSHQSYMRMAMLQYCNVLLCEHGGNQIINVTPAEMLGYLRMIWNFGRLRGMPAIQVLLGPRTTGAWTSAASQTGYATDFEPGGKRDQLNALILADLAAGLVDYVIDVNSVWEDPANPGKWKTSGGVPTTDGTHPNTMMHAAAAPLVSATMAQVVADHYPTLMAA